MRRSSRLTPGLRALLKEIAAYKCTSVPRNCGPAHQLVNLGLITMLPIGSMSPLVEITAAGLAVLYPRHKLGHPLLDYLKRQKLSQEEALRWIPPIEEFRRKGFTLTEALDLHQEHLADIHHFYSIAWSKTLPENHHL